MRLRRSGAAADRGGSPRVPAGPGGGAPLPADVLGRFERSLWRPPTWVFATGLTLYGALAVVDLVLGQYRGAVGVVVLGGLVLVSGVASRRQGPAVTELAPDGITVEMPFRKPQSVRWEQVRGMRVLSRRNAPQALLADGRQVQLLGLPDDVARAVAARLPALLGRPVVFEVDDRPVSLTVDGGDPPGGREQRSPP